MKFIIHVRELYVKKRLKAMSRYWSLMEVSSLESIIKLYETYIHVPQVACAPLLDPKQKTGMYPSMGIKNMNDIIARCPNGH